MLRPYLSRVRACTGPDPAQFDHMRTNFDAELVQEHLADRAAGHPGHRFPGARALQDVARVLAVVLEGAREIRVARPRTRPCDSPAVVNRNITRARGSSRDSALPLKRHDARLRADAEPRVHSRASRRDSMWLASPDNSTRARLRVGLARSPRGSGGEASRSPRRLWVDVRDGRQ